MIGLIAAEKEETGNLIKIIKAKILELNGVRYYIGSLNDKQIVVCFSGIGKTNAAATAMNMIINFGVKVIFNIGLCGTCKQNIKPGSIIIVNDLTYSDVDLTALNYPLNQLPEEPASYPIKGEYVEFLKTVIKDPIIGAIASSDSIITINNVEAFPSLVDKNIVGFDMEAAAIAQVCNKTHVDMFCVKLVSDNLSFDASTKDQYNTNYKALAAKICDISAKVLEFYVSK